MTIAERFASKWIEDKETGCHEWQGAKERGYGKLRKGSASEGFARAHRVSWEITHGEIPEGLVICHTCDNPGCVNEGHLFIGTRTDNNRDRHNKGRSAKGAALREAVLGTLPDRTGELNDNAKLTENDIQEIRNLLRQGMKQTVIARQFKISQTQVSRINLRAAWKEVL